MDKTNKESARSPVSGSKRAAEVESISDQKKLKLEPVYGIAAAEGGQVDHKTSDQY